MWLKDHFPIKKLVDSGYVFDGEASPEYTGELGDTGLHGQLQVVSDGQTYSVTTEREETPVPAK